MTLRKFLRTNFKPLYCIWYGERKDSWIKTRYCCSALAGILSGWLLYKFMVKSLLISKEYEILVLSIIISIVVSGFLFTDGVKCITLLVFLSLFGKSGRSYMRALTFAFIISGPIENLSSNTGEIVRTFSCSKILAINLTRTRFDLLIKPFQKTIVHMRDDITKFQSTFNQLRNVTEELHKEVMLEDVNENLKASNASVYRNYQADQQLNEKYIENRYKNKFKMRCLKQLDNGKIRCRKAFANAHKRCYDQMPFLLKTLLCWAFKVDFLCNINILGNPQNICNPSDAVADNFAQTYVELVSAEHEIYQPGSNVKVNYEILNSTAIPGVKTAEETAKSVLKEFNIRKQVFDSIIKILQQFLGLMIVRILYGCINYYKGYKINLAHDNIYVTDYFKDVDRRRKSKNKPSLLPLKKYEKSSLIDEEHSGRRTHEESQAVTFYLLQFSLEIVTCCLFLFLDYIVVSVLLIIRNNSEMEFVQEGEHTIHFQIQGSGLIARLLRNTMRNFNMHETVSTYLSNKTCLPIPTILPRSFYTNLLALYIFVMLLIYHSSRFLRMRHLICGYFYRKHEKRRILYLYNSLLKQRRYIRETMLKEAKYNFANRQIRLKANLFLILRLKWPQYFDWLGRFHMGCRKCLICGELEDSKFFLCRNEACKVSYCSECFHDIENKCWICDTVLSVEIILNFNDFFEQFSFV